MNTKVIITAEDQTGAGIASVKSSLAGLGSVVGALTPLLTGFSSAFSAGAFISFIKGSIDAADAMKDLSERTGLSIKELATWELAAKQSGAGLESVAQGIKGLSKYMVGHSRDLQAAGITATTTNGAMLQLADLFQKLPDGALKSALAVKVFGRAGDALIPMLNQGSKGLAEANEKSADYAKRLEELAPKADQFNDQMTELGLQSKAAGMNIANYFLPGLIGMSKWLNDIASGGEKAQQAVAWMIGERNMKAMVLMGHPMLTGPDKRSSSGRISGKSAGMSIAEEEALAERNMAGLAAAGIVGKPEKDGKGKAAAKTPLQKMIELGERNLAAAKAAEYVAADDDEEARLGANKRAMESARLQKQEADAANKRAEAIKDGIEPLRVLARQIEEVNALRAAGMLTADEASAAEDRLTTQFAKQREAALDLNKSGTDAFKELGDAIQGWGNKAADTFAEFVVTGKASFSDLINSMLMDIARLQAKKMLDPITKGAGDWLSGLFSSSGGAGSMSGNGSVQGNSAYIYDLHSGGIAGSGEGSGRHLRNLALFAGAPKYHGGGLAGDEVPAVLKRGEGVFTPGQMKALGGGGTAPNIVVNVINHTGQPATARQQGAPSFDGSNWVISVIMEAAGSNPGFRAAMGLGR